MACSMCFFWNPLQWFAVLLPLLISTAFLGCGFFLSLLFTVSLVLLFYIFFTFSKHKPVFLDTSMEVEPNLEPENEDITQEADVGQIQDYMVRPLDPFSESYGTDHSSITDQDSEAEWGYSGNPGQYPGSSDGSISDEESLIEIALPSGQYVCTPEKEEPKFNLQKKFPDLMELLADMNEMNEEDNLIEIDISMGSIKCSRFGIEA